MESARLVDDKRNGRPIAMGWCIGGVNASIHSFLNFLLGSMDVYNLLYWY